MFKDAEPNFLKLVKALQEFGDSVVFVGGWLPFLYTKYLWKDQILSPIFTEDIDIGIRFFHGHKRTLEDCLQEFPFIQKVDDLGDDRELIRLVLLDREKTYPIDIITGDPDPGQFTKLSGKKLEVINSLNNFDILVNPKYTMQLLIKDKKESIFLRAPKPSAYLFHKGITFEERRQAPGVDHKFKKDLWSIFYILANVPHAHKQTLISEIQEFSKDSDYPYFLEALELFFGTSRSPGVAHVASFYPEMGKQIQGMIFEELKKLRNELMKM